MPSNKCQGPSKEVKFLGTWWIAGQAMIPDETITKLDAIHTPTTKKEQQQIMSTWGYWRNHVLGVFYNSKTLIHTNEETSKVGAA